MRRMVRHTLLLLIFGNTVVSGPETACLYPRYLALAPVKSGFLRCSYRRQTVGAFESAYTTPRFSPIPHALASVATRNLGNDKVARPWEFRSLASAATPMLRRDKALVLRQF